MSWSMCALRLVKTKALGGRLGQHWPWPVEQERYRQGHGPGCFTYVDNFYGPVRVNETHHGGCNPGNFDTLGENLSIPDLADAGQTITIPWFSDFNFFGVITSCDTQLEDQK